MEILLTSLTKNRIESLGLLKGLVMVIMALDLTWDFVHSAAFFYDPTDPSQTSVLIYLTRWITHFCAPAFCLLARRCNHYKDMVSVFGWRTWCGLQ